MFILSERKLKIVEYDRNTIKTPNVHMKSPQNPNNGTLSFSSLKLNIAIGRCILSKDLTNLDLLFEASSSFMRYQTIINSSNLNLRLNKQNFELLRDFSRYSRIGELAQGVTYLFSQEYLNYPIVIDFKGFLKSKNKNAIIQGKTPDFILQKKSNFNYSLIESKGHYVSSSNSTKGVLRDALKQCKDGRSNINSALKNYNCNKSFGVCLKLQNEQAAKNSKIQYVDPNFEKIKNDKINLETIRYHYASWFLLMGNINIYNKLLGSQYIDKEDINFGSKKKINDRYYQMFNFFPPSNFLLNFYCFPSSRHKINKYGILMDVLELLMGEKDNFTYKTIKNIQDYESENYDIFGDGTIIESRMF